MTTYTVQWKYASSYGGPWLKDAEVELDDAVATAVNRDSPGVLVPANDESKPKPAAKPKTTTRTRAKKAPAKTRQVTKAKADR